MSCSVACGRCGQVFDPADRPVCEVTGRLCKPGDPAPVDRGEAGESADSAETAAESGETVPETGDNRPTTGDTGDDSDHDAPARPGPAVDETGQFLPGDPAARERGGHELPGSRGHGRPDHRKYDWPEIKRRYVEGYNDGTETVWPTLDAVAEHFGLPAQRIREKSATDGWRAARTQWQAQVEATRRQARANALAKKGLDLDNKAFDVASLGLQLCQAKLAEVAQAAQTARSNAGPGGGSGGIIDSMEMQRIAAAVDVFHKVGLRAIGDPEVHRVELSGPAGQPIEIASELRRDDPSRLTGVLSVLQQAGLGDLFGPDSAAVTTLEAQRGADGTYSTELSRR